MNKIKIIKGKYGGFCFGVERAYRMVISETEQSDKVHIMGALAHNKGVTDSLAKRGAKEIENLDQIKEGIVVFTAHGAEPELYSKAQKMGLKIVDTTCPKVMRVQKLAQKHALLKDQIIIFGDKNHKEVKNIYAWSDKTAIIITNLTEAKKIKLDCNKKYCLLSQTTQDLKKFEKIEEYLKEKLNESLISYKTICPSTLARQIEAAELARSGEVVIVIGGKTSANSRRLYEVARRINQKTYFIEDKEGLVPEWFRKINTVSIIAGASTLNDTIEEVISLIKSLNDKTAD